MGPESTSISSRTEKRSTVSPVDTRGEKVGQINGLSIVELGDYAFGHPTRITARAHVGKGDVVDIEREVELGGPIHSKGVLILAGLLGARYAPRTPLSLSASIVFEQSYAGVEGDSASLAELCALLSAIAEVPIKQTLAVTGSVNQHGEIQPIGGVNEKIEGFFDVCRERGLTGEHGVLIPRGNVQHLMLRKDVIAAVVEKRFHVYAISDVDEAIALVTGRSAAARGRDGAFPAGSVNALVEARLTTFAEDASWSAPRSADSPRRLDSRSCTRGTASWSPRERAPRVHCRPEVESMVADGQPIRDIGTVWDAVLSGFLGHSELCSVIDRSLDHYYGLVVPHRCSLILDPHRLGDASSIAHSAFLALALLVARGPDCGPAVDVVDRIVDQQRKDGSYAIYFGGEPDDGVERIRAKPCSRS